MLFTVCAHADSPPHDAPPQQVIVKFSHPGQGEAHRAERAREAIEDVSRGLGIQLQRLRTLATGSELIEVKSPPGLDQRGEVVRAFRNNPHVEYAEIDTNVHIAATPNDPRYADQWHYYESAGGLNLPKAWDIATGSGVRVAVLDTGYRPHTDLASNLIGGYDFLSSPFHSADGDGRDSDSRDPGDHSAAGECGSGSQARPSSWHGTHVAGTIAAVTNNSKGVAGVAYGSKVVPVRVLGKCGGRKSDVAEAIIWAAGGPVSGVPGNSYPAKVINLSLGGFEPKDPNQPPGSVDPYSLTPPGENLEGICPAEIQNAINSARSRGSVVVAAAGNWNSDVSDYWPANCNGVVAVAGTDRDGGKWTEATYIGSNFGAAIDVAAPTGNRLRTADGVLSTHNTGSTSPGSDSYEYLVGTSMAAPHVSGVAALMLQVKPNLTPDQIESKLKSTARGFPKSCTGCGKGIVHAAKAVISVDAPKVSVEYMGCSGYGSQYLISWHTSKSSAVLEWDVDYQTYGNSTWYSYYNGKNISVLPVVHNKTRYRVRAKYSGGWTPFTTTAWLTNHCSGGGGGGFDPY